MAKTRVSFSISDAELEKTLTELMEKRVKDFCLDSIKQVVNSELRNDMRVNAIKVADKRLQDYELISMYKEELKKQISSRIQDVWGDINKEIQKVINATVKESLENGRYEVFIETAIKNQFKEYVQGIVQNIYSQKAEGEDKE